MKVRLSLIFITLSFFFLSCSSGISQKGEASVTVDLSDFIQRVSSRAAGNDQTATVNLRIEGDFVTTFTETVSTSEGSIKLDNLPIGKTITISLETTIAHKCFEGFSDPVKIKSGNNQVTIRLVKNGISTDYVLYNYDSGTYNYFLTDSPSASIPEQSEYNSNRNLFCFDNDGYFYYADDSTLHSDNPKFTSAGVSIGTNLVEYNAPGISVDLKTNELYISTDTGDLRLTKFPKLISNASSEESVMYTSPEAFDATFNQGTFVVYDGIVYAICYNSNEGNMLVKFDLSDVTASAVDYFTINQGSIIDLDWNSFGFSNNASITDMIYQDGAVYILVREYETDSIMNSTYSRGAIIKYDIATGECTTSNTFASKHVLNTFTAASWYSQYVSADSAYKYFIVYDSQDKSNYHIEEFTCESDPSNIVIAAPYNNSDSCFVGPERFIAIKPKKLVISDTGLAFYTNADGAITYKNINRVIEIDLKTLSITDKTNANVEFNNSYTFAPTTNTSGRPKKTEIHLNGKYSSKEAIGTPSAITSTSGFTLYPYFIKEN